jgi:D-amino peptidase
MKSAFSSPGTPKMYSMFSFSRQATNSSDAFMEDFRRQRAWTATDGAASPPRARPPPGCPDGPQRAYSRSTGGGKRGAGMRVFISVDMEGISGLVRWPDVTNGIDYERGRRFLTADTNAAIAGAFAGGATEVVVEENHGVQDLCNVLMDEIDPRCEVVRGAGRGGATTMSALTAESDVIFFVGHHARAGSRPGIMAHTIDYKAFSRVRVQGEDIGEPDLFTWRGAELGVPVGLVTGDQVVAEQVQARSPAAEAVIVKRALSNQAARCVPPARAAALIEAGAARAMARLAQGALKPYDGPLGPFEIEVELRAPATGALAENLQALPEFGLSDSRTVTSTAPDAQTAFRRIAYLGYADRPGIIRY